MAQTFTSGVISIPNVTGNIVITATAVQSAPAYTNLWDASGATDGYRYNSSGGLTAETGYVASNVFPFPDDGQDHVVRVKGIDMITGSVKKFVYCTDAQGTLSSGGATTPAPTVSDGVYTFTAKPYKTGTNSNYAKLSGTRVSPLTDIIITIDEEIS